MMDIKNFDDYAIDSWVEDNCLWSRLQGMAKDFSSAVKSNLMPAAVAVAVGAVVFSPPASAWEIKSTAVMAGPHTAEFASKVFEEKGPVNSSGDESSVQRAEKLNNNIEQSLANLRARSFSRFSDKARLLAVAAVQKRLKETA
jgi:hypothetical protein